ncbi:MAG: DUF1566 domain-containing protein [bacterium]
MKTTNGLNFFLLFVGVIVLTLGLSISTQSLIAGLYTAPLSNPATCTSGNPGCGAPLSLSSNLVQTLQGSIWVVNSAYPTSPYGLIVGSGNVGIGISSPSATLDVVGNIKVTQGITIGNSTLTTAGTIRWTGTALEVYTGSSWLNFITPQTRTYTCSARPGSNTEWNTVSSYTQTWTGSAWSPADDATTEYNATADMASCRYTCVSGYTWSGSACIPLSIGLAHQGGKIAYLSGFNSGLIAALSDQSTAAAWGCSGTAISGADGTAIGTGNQNTIDIMAGCATAGIAARLCRGVTINGYTDWYLPSKDELNQLYINRVAIGGFTTNYYWSSSEYDANYAWSQYFYDGFQGYYIKSNAYYVRCVRAF